MNQLILGDNLQVMKEMPDNSIDLIYLDPPFFSNRNYEVIWGDKGEIASFEDRWSGGMEHYIVWLKERVAEMHRLLKPTGSIFLHCDWHASAYIRVYILDKIFGESNFRGEIIWQRTNTHNDAKKKLGVVTDSIFYYSKSEIATYNPIYVEHSEQYKDAFYKYDDNDGRGPYSLDNMASPNPRPNMMYDWLGFPFPIKGWRYEKETMKKLHEEGRIYYPKLEDGSYDFTKRLRLKRYLREQKGAIVGNLWNDIQNVQAFAKERIGYPTQKPEALLARIIKMASKEGDVILDGFMGGGTTMVVAEKLARQWIGIDSSVQAIKVTEMRLEKAQGLFSPPFVTRLHKYDYDWLRYSNAFVFERFIVQQFGGISNGKQRGDLGIDGRTRDGEPIQVKRSDKISRNVVDNFLSAAQRYDKALFNKNREEGKPIGFLISFSFGEGAIKEVARLKLEGIIIELVPVEKIVPIATKPNLWVSFKDLGMDKQGSREIAFSAVAQSEAGVLFYAWDWSYNDSDKVFSAEVLRDIEGRQNHKFTPGFHHVAVKAIDGLGMETIELIKIKVNGEVSEKDRRIESGYRRPLPAIAS